MHRSDVRSAGGFTLLEVIVALAITGFVLGGLFSLVGGSKQLTWRSQESLTRASQIRAATNFALLQNEFADVEEILEQDAYRVRPGEVLEAPERKTQPTVHQLQAYEIVNSDRDEVIDGVRWIQLDLPQ
jgi:prepilin-type N-terminal cleavage/methylation domain-containing protein